MKFFEWIRNGIHRAVVDGFRDAVIEITDVGHRDTGPAALEHENEAPAITNGNGKQKKKQRVASSV